MDIEGISLLFLRFGLGGIVLSIVLWKLTGGDVLSNWAFNKLLGGSIAMTIVCGGLWVYVRSLAP